jgi:hypothetical protein
LRAVDALLNGLVDYAGLFPPANESMNTALEHYRAYRGSADRAALGRFIVPLSRLRELDAESRGLLPTDDSSDPWMLSVLVSGDVRAASEEMLEFNRRHSIGSSDGQAIIDVVELKATDRGQIERQHSALPRSFTSYFEIPLQGEIGTLVDELASVGARAKIRTGGVTADAFPSAQNVVAFMAACLRKRVPFKATAGLHHPIRGTYRLTYEAGSATGVMFGFLNVFMAAALLYSGQDETQALAVLDETDASAFTFTDDAITWRGVEFDANRIKALRSEFAISFGSCSFREPVDELATLDPLSMASHR